MTTTLVPRPSTIERNDPRTGASPAGGKIASLHEAAAGGDRAAVGWHLARATPVSTRSADGWTALHLAAFGGHARVVQMLVGAGARPDDRSCHDGGCTGATALHLAAAAGHAEVVTALLAAGSDPRLRDDAGYTALHLASERGDLPVVRALLKGGAPVDPTLGDLTALDLARRERHQAIVGLLRQLGAR